MEKVILHTPYIGAVLLTVLLGSANTVSAVEFQLVTNYVEAHEDFRKVDGKLYNRARSTLWRDVEGDCLATIKSGVIVQEVKIEKIYGPPEVNSLERIGAVFSRGPVYRPLLRTDRIPGKKFFVKNYPTNPKPLTGSTIACRVLPIGTIDFAGETIAAYDYGTPSIVPVVRTNWPSRSAPSDPPKK
jgi:hypothetical protein